MFIFGWFGGIGCVWFERRVFGVWEHIGLVGGNLRGCFVLSKRDWELYRYI